jgi:serine/threonine-protein kinase
MGVVYKGWEPSLNRRVAIKALGEHLLNDEDLVERFTREAKATAALNNPNVIQIYFIGKEQGQPYFAMEYIEGQSLDDILKGGHALSIKHAKNILKQACMGLSAAHDIDLVHRDIKPANIMLTNDGALKIVDFGIARTREYGDKLTNTGEFVGTPGYLSPEVCIGKEVDQRSDIFSLGIVFYEMLAGKVPFENDSPLGLMLEVVQSNIPDIRALNKKVDKKTSYILNKMIAKAPEERYQSCNEIIRDLGNVIENENISTIKNNASVVKNQPVKSNISEQITLKSNSAITEKHLLPSQKPKSNKKWLIAATLFTIFAAAGIGYVGGYLPIPGNNTDNYKAHDVNALFTTDLTTPTAETIANTKDLSAETNSLQGIAEDINQDVPAETVDNTTIDFPEIIDFKDKFNRSITDQTDGNITNPAQIQQAEDYDNSAISSLAANANFNTIASHTVTQGYGVTTEKTQVSATNPKPVAIKKIVKKVAVLNKGVVVIAFGDPAIANPVEKIIESQLKQQGIKVMNEQFISGMRQLLDNGMDLAKIKNLIQKNGGQAMVIANVNYVGSQELQYAGRYSELISAQLDVDSYDIKTGDSIGEGFGSKIDYTSLNATDQAADAVMQFTDRLTENLRKII